MALSKLTRQLRDRLDRTPDDSLVEVVLEILSNDDEPPAAGASRSELMEAARKRFREAVAPVEEHVQRLGGEVLDRGWLNRTLRVRVPKRSVNQVTESASVRSADTPRPISRD